MALIMPDRKGHIQIAQPHDHILGPAAPRRGPQAKGGTGNGAQADGDQTDHDGGLRPGHDHRKDIAAKLISAEPVAQAGRTQTLENDDFGR